MSKDDWKKLAKFSGTVSAIAGVLGAIASFVSKL